MTYPHPEPEQDLWEEATKEPPRFFFGELTTHIRKVTFVYDGNSSKWQLNEYDPALYEKIKLAPRKPKGTARENGDGFNTYTATFTLAPLDPVRLLDTREMSPSNPKDTKWSIVKASIEAVAPKIAEIKGLTMGQFRPEAEISGMYVSGEYVPQKKPNEQYKTFKFTAVYTGREECEAAYAAQLQAAGEPDIPAVQAEKQPAVSGENRAAMAAFLPPLWVQAQKSPTPMAEMNKLLKANSMLAVFNLASPEVVALTGSDDPAGDFEQEIAF